MKNLILLTAMAAICHVALARVPTISSFTPASGPIGAQVTISGANYSATPADIAYTVSPFTVTRTGSGDLDFTTVSFTAPVNLAGDDNITAADIDGDHCIDLICGYGSNKITVYRNTTVGGNISFTPVDIGGSYYLPMSTKAGDLHGDGFR